jgi:hypothetical protein
MATVLGECTNEEQHSVVRLLWAKGLNARDIHKKCCLLTVGSVCRKWVDKRGKPFADEEVETDVRKWLRQLSKKKSMLRVSTHW